MAWAVVNESIDLNNKMASMAVQDVQQSKFVVLNFRVPDSPTQDLDQVKKEVKEEAKRILNEAAAYLGS